MPLPDGSTLGSYEVLSALGVGGMGEVYRARDTKLGREVAIKVLPDSFAADPDRLARFQREAQVLASLNHPNIAHVHGLEESGSVRALVMELVQGEDLAVRLSRGPIPLDEALPIARQIAEAVEAAHEVGIVHRDLKPANIKVRSDGVVKVLDFGLAKALDTASAGRDVSSGDPASNSPTITTPAMTRAGVILGTAAYMSPEQARGKPVDKRADIWAFGVVLYEMLSGARPFTGDTVSDVLAAVLTREPDLTALPASTPGPVRRLLRRCLERDPRQRLRDIGDARFDLGDGAQADAAVAPAAPSLRRTIVLPWIVAAVGLILAAVGFLRAPAGPVATMVSPTSRFTLLPGPAGEIDGFPAISPDGQTIVFGVIPDDGVSHLWEFSFVTGESRLLPNTDYGTEPFWSPDGRSVAYFSRGQIRRIEMATGLSRALAPASDNRGGTWTEGGEIIFTPNSATGLFRVSAEGGQPVPLTTLDPSTEESHRYPTALPGGQTIIYTAVAADNSPQVGLFWRSLRDGTTRRLAPEVSRTAFDPRGFLLWMRQGGLVAQRFDPRAGALTGEPFPIAAQVGTDLQRSGKGWFDAGAGIVATRATTSQMSQLRWYDRAGKRIAEVTSPGRFYEPALSPDGRSVAVSVGGADAPRGDIWVFDTGGKDRARRLTFGGVDTPMWSSDGRWVMFGRRGTGGSAITRRLADGSGAEETIYVHPHNAFVNTVSPRDPLAAFESYGRDGNEDLWLLPLDGERKARPLLETPAAEGHSAFSPDGRLLAYTSDESGLPQIYVREVGGAGNRWQLTTEGGDVAAWGSRGREIFYVGLDRVLRALPITQMVPFQFGEPVKLFRLEIPSLAISGNRTFYTPSPDGQRFLVNAQVAPESEPGLRMVLNWRPPTGS